MSKNNKKIPKIDSKQKRLINNSVAIVDTDEDESTAHFKISYKYYNTNFCEIDNLHVSCARKCLIKLKLIGQSNRKTLYNNNIRPKPVHNSGNYKTLFSKLDDDVDLFEIQLGDASRLFYFTVGHLFHIVSIKNSHIEC